MGNTRYSFSLWSGVEMYIGVQVLQKVPEQSCKCVSIVITVINMKITDRSQCMSLLDLSDEYAYIKRHNVLLCKCSVHTPVELGN